MRFERVIPLICAKKRTLKAVMALRIPWQGQKESNPRHAVLETAALPAELCPYFNADTESFLRYQRFYSIKYPYMFVNNFVAVSCGRCKYTAVSYCFFAH